LLHAYPQLVHLGEVGQHEVDGIVYIALVLILRHHYIGQDVSGALQQVVAQEEAPQWVLDTFRILRGSNECGIEEYVLASWPFVYNYYNVKSA